ncbi:MAG TPA: hypothetical protein VJA47_04095 [archaeon]|nr:hypothetical protein [archaeon]
MKSKYLLAILVLISVILISGCAQSGPSIKVKSPANGSVLNVTDVTIELETQNFKDGNVLVNIDKDKKDYATSSKYTAKGLLPGEHTAVFTLQRSGKNITENGKVLSASITFTIKAQEGLFGKATKEQVDTKGLPTPPALPPSLKAK